jgi:hypothetical protein
MVGMETRPPAHSDRRHGLTKTLEMVVAALPGLGGPAGVMLNELAYRRLAERRDDWLEELALRLIAIEGRVGSLEDLTRDDHFVDALVTAGRIGERSHEKREMLRNAVLNVALAAELTNDRRHVLFDLVDRLPPGAVRLLKFVADKQYREGVIGYDPAPLHPVLLQISDVACLLVPTPDPGTDDGDVAIFFERQCERLRDEGLLDVGALSESGYQREHGYFAHHVRLDAVTRFGRSFLNFIEDPRDRE